MPESFDQLSFAVAVLLLGFGYVVTPVVMLGAGALELVELRRTWRFNRDATCAEAGLCGPAYVSLLEQAAYHEAGHILVAAVFGIPTEAAFITEHGTGRVFNDVDLEPTDPIEEAVPLILVWVAGPIAEAKLACCNAQESIAAAMSDLGRASKAIGVMVPLETVEAERAALLVFGRATLILMHECRQTLEQLVRLLLEKRLVRRREVELITERSKEIAAARAKLTRRKWKQHLMEMVQKRLGP